jgi:hypothetical protein
MRRITLAGLLSIALFAAVAPVAGAYGGAPLETAGRTVNGVSPGGWLGRWWKAVLETPSPQDRYPGCVALAHSTVGAVFGPEGGVASCSVARGSSLVLVPQTVSCSDFEEYPFHGDSPAERLACSIRGNQGAAANVVIVDRQRVRLTDAYRAPAPDQRTTLPADNLLGAPAGTEIEFGAEGWLGITKPLARGHHEIVMHAKGTFEGEPYALDARLHVDVR